MSDIVSATAGPSTSRSHRYDIQCLRALAVGGVVVNHLFPNRLTGGYLGVDIFFVISGFLITAHLAGELDRTNKVKFSQFWARRARRLLPAALTVLGLCLIATWLWLPQAKWSQVCAEILASALYFQNWQLAASATDYFTSSQSASPVTHYWSLSVEEQFYLIWPLIAAATWWLARRFGAVNPRRALIIVMAVIAALSLATATWWLQAHPAAGYFVTPGRAWEFAVGGLLGCASRLPAVPRWLAAPGWVAMLGSMVLFGDDSGVPGPLTLVPVLGCAVVILAGSQTGGMPTPSWLRVPEWIGNISYSVYLWHWPLIVFAPLALQRPMTPLLGVVLAGLTLLLSDLSTRFIEDPFRRARVLTKAPVWRTYAAAALAMAVVAGASFYLPTTLANNLQDVQAELEAAVEKGGDCVGALAGVNECPRSHELAFANASLVDITNSWYSFGWGTACQVEPEDPAPAPCEFGVPSAEAKQHVVLVGDSHAGQWASALDPIARRRGWNVQMQVKSSCQIGSGDYQASWSTPAAVESCFAWSKEVNRAIKDASQVDLVITSNIARDYVSSDPDGGLSQLRTIWQGWVDSGKQVMVIGDVPYLNKGSLPECLGVATTTDDPCAAPAKEARRDPLAQAARGLAGVSFFDPTPYLCDRQKCHAVVGGLPVYGDQNHLIHYFARTFEPVLDEAFASGR